MIVTMEEREALVEQFVLILTDTGNTATHTLTFGTCAGKGDCRYAIVNQFINHLLTRPILIAKGKEEAITNFLFVSIFVINDMKTIAKHNLLDQFSSSRIFAGGGYEVNLALACRLEHGCHSKLDRVRNARREAIEHVVYQIPQELAIVLVS